MLHALIRLHGLLLGLIALGQVAHCWWQLWRAQSQWPVTLPPCDGAWPRRLRQAALWVWATALSGALTWATGAALPATPVLRWGKLIGAGSALLTLTTAALAAQRLPQGKFVRTACRQRRFWLACLSVGLLGLLAAALIGALSHYFA